MKILVISDVPWNEDNSVGNTYSNIFKNMENAKFANLYCKPGTLKSKIPAAYYQITEKQLVQKLIGKIFFINRKNKKINNNKENNFSTLNTIEQKLYDILRNCRFTFFFILREVVWKVGNWKTKDLDYFLKEFDPDVIFTFCLDSLYYSNIIDYCRVATKSSLILFFADDVYAYKSINPLNLAYQYLIRKKIKKLSGNCRLIYGATPKLCEEYSKILNSNLYPLYKICDEVPEIKTSHNNPLKFTYAGNLFYGRWQVLALLLKAIKEINKDSTKIILNIYTSGLVNNRMIKSLNVIGISKLAEGLPYDEIKEILKKSDMVVHVESFERSEIKKTRLSFSTKIVDCMQSGTPLLAIGPSEAASIDMLKTLDIAQVITCNDKEKIKSVLIKIIDNINILTETSQKMKQYVIDYHSQSNLKVNLYDRLSLFIKGDIHESCSN